MNRSVSEMLWGFLIGLVVLGAGWAFGLYLGWAIKTIFGW